MEEKETITISYYAKVKGKSIPGIYQALKRENNKYNKYVVYDENGKRKFKKEILTELDIEESGNAEEIKATPEENENDHKRNIDLASSGIELQYLRDKIEEQKKQIESTIKMYEDRIAEKDRITEERLQDKDKQIEYLKEKIDSKEKELEREQQLRFAELGRLKELEQAEKERTDHIILEPDIVNTEEEKTEPEEKPEPETAIAEQKKKRKSLFDFFRKNK